MQPKLTLRDLFWLTLVVAMALGWYLHAWQTADARQLARENERLRRDLNALTVQIELQGYNVVSSSIGPFVQRNTEIP